ncbi:MAG TPA: ATP-binding protein [Dehalococcoidia bacterium]|nr:ATP-binding protein [Dehalococcoidia bacterium]
MQVMLVEDNPGDARLIQEMLRDVQSQNFVFQHATSLAGALAHLESESADVLLLDLGLPDSQGVDTLLRARAGAPHLPIVVLTGLDDEEMALESLQLGAQDYLVKGQMESGPLSRCIRYAVERNQVDGMLRETLNDLEARTQEMESFVYSVSHDLKEPLRTLEAFSRFLLEDYSDVLDDQGRDYLSRLAAASARLKDMIEELLMLTRLGRRPHEMERISVETVVESIIAANQVGIQERNAVVTVDGDLPDVRADRSHVEQIFGNLIGNALKFNASGSPSIEIGVSDARAGWVTFFVRDNGIGIAPEYHERIFGIFQRLHLREEYEGTGAGLAIVKRAAETLDGTVWLESEFGAGATFFVRLPKFEGVRRLSRRAVELS